MAIKFNSRYIIIAAFIFLSAFVLISYSQKLNEPFVDIAKSVVVIVPDVQVIHPDPPTPKIKASAKASAGPCKKFDVSIASVVRVRGTACLVPPSINVCISVLGRNIGCFKQFTITFNVGFAKGFVKFIIRNKALFVQYEVCSFGKCRRGEQKLFNF